MKYLFYFIGLLPVIFYTTAQAQDLATDVIPAFYFSAPLGGTEDVSNASQIGFRLARVDEDISNHYDLFSSSEQSLFDLSFTSEGMKKMAVGGIDIQQATSILYANGSGTANYSHAEIAAAILVGGVLIYAIAESDEVRVCSGSGCENKPDDPDKPDKPDEPD